MFFFPIKHVLRVFLNGFKNIPLKTCLLGAQTKVQVVRENISIQEKQAMPYQCSLYKEY